MLIFIYMHHAVISSNSFKYFFYSFIQSVSPSQLPQRLSQLAIFRSWWFWWYFLSLNLRRYAWYFVLVNRVFLCCNVIKSSLFHLFFTLFFPTLPTCFIIIIAIVCGGVVVSYDWLICLYYCASVAVCLHILPLSSHYWIWTSFSWEIYTQVCVFTETNAMINLISAAYYGVQEFGFTFFISRYGMSTWVTCWC